MTNSAPGFRIQHDWNNGIEYTLRSSSRYMFGRWHSPISFKSFLNKNRNASHLRGYDHVVGIGNVELFAMTIQEFDDLLKMNWRKRKKYMEVLAKAGEIERIRLGLRHIKQLEHELAALKAEMATL